jgi:hypothetical protein
LEQKNAMKTKKDGQLSVMLIPHSEHSNFEELRSFLGMLKPINLIPTVFQNDADERAILKRFSDLTDKTEGKRSFLKAIFDKAAVAAKGGTLMKCPELSLSPAARQTRQISGDEVADKSPVPQAQRALKLGKGNAVVEIGSDCDEVSDDLRDTDTLNHGVASSSFAVRSEKWTCKRCTFLNGPLLVACEMCGHEPREPMATRSKSKKTETDKV